MKKTVMHFLFVTMVVAISSMPAQAAQTWNAAQPIPDGNTVLLDHFDGSTLANYVGGDLAYVDNITGLYQGAALSETTWLKYDLPGWYQWSYNYDPSGKSGSVDFWVYPHEYGKGLLTFQWNNTTTPAAGGYIFHFGINANGKLSSSVWSAIAGGPSVGSLTGATTIPLNEWTHVGYSWGPNGTALYVNGNIDAQSTYDLYPALSSTFYVYVGYWGGNSFYIDELRIEDSPTTLANEACQDQQAQIGQLEDEVGNLTTENSDLTNQVDTLTQQNTQLQSQVDSLTQQNAQLQNRVAQLNATMSSGIASVENDFRTTFKSPTFVIKGDNSAAQFQALIDAILGLNKGRKEGLVEALK